MAYRVETTKRPVQTYIPAPRALPRHVRLYAQHIGDDSWTLPDGSTTTDMVLTRDPVPASLANANDYVEAAVTETTSTLKIDQRFVLADNFMQDLVIEGLAKAVVRVGAKGDGTYNTYIDRIIVNIEKVDENGNYISLVSKDITLSSALSNSATDWETWDWQVLLSLSRQTIEPDEQLVLRVRVYAHMAEGGTDQTVRLYHTRGSQDTYVDIPLDEI